ncbi:MAG: hypothetical protein E7644_08075 [Ruminococcaceae bacterium]|nr:hypothetical protein [Oscillospiraceae bacterium]
MYCSKCGKEIDYDATVCRECQQAEAAAAPAPKGNPRMRGFGRALIGSILGILALVGDFLGYLVNMILMGAVSWYGASMSTARALANVICIFVFISGIIAVILGVCSIKAAKSTPNGHPRPVPTLILGITATVCGGLALLCIMMPLLPTLMLLLE